MNCCLIAMIIVCGITYYSYKKKNRLYHAIISQNNRYIQREQILTRQIESLRSETNTLTSPTLSSDKMNDLALRFTALMTEQKLYTDPSITVAAVAEKLETNRTYLSKAINESMGKTFTQLINEYRICEAIAEISDLKSNKPLKQIAFEAGFSNLSTFYSSFQAATGMTPALYRSKLKKE